jgi:menaquinone-dependent protoporphyrinogen oxidase
MNEKVLVAYATKYGATAEIAEKIGRVLQQAGLNTEVLLAKRVGKLTPYKAVILGSAVYIGAWRNEAVKFLQVHDLELAKMPVWLFSSGPTGEGNPVELLQGWRIPNTLQPLINRIQPRDIAVFHGNVDLNKANFIEKWMIKNVKSPQGDFRDWNAITAWAESIADAINRLTPPLPSP